MTKNKILNVPGLIFFLEGLEGIFASLWLIQLPSDSSSAIFLHLSPARLAILVTIFGIACVFFVAGALSKTKPGFNDRVKTFCTQKNPALLIISSIVLASLCITSLSILSDLYRSTGLYFYNAYAQRLAPLLVYLSVLLVQSAGLIAYLNHQRLSEFFQAEKTFLRTWLLVLGGLTVIGLLITLTRFGLDPDPIGWGKPTVPLLEWQIWLGIIFCLLSRFFSQNRIFKLLATFQRNHVVLSGIIISVLIWGMAVLVWAGQPVPPGFFATPPRPPNFEIYPFSDAAFYDFHAQSMLIGLGFRGDSIPPRPLYILFLAAAHLIGGQDYNRVILVQTLVLALFPMIVFWIGRKIANQTVGLIAAFFVIFREWTSILSTPFTSDISNSKLLFADLPAALAISLLLLMVICWLEKPRQQILAILAGGLLGISLLVRTQIIILLPVILFFFWIAGRKIKFSSLVFSLSLFVIGFILAISPWLSRSYHITGQLVFDHPESQTRVMAERFSPDTPLVELDRQSGESVGDYNLRLSTFIKQQIFKNPLALVQFTTAHWINSEISNVLIFPVRFSIKSPGELIIPQHAFWEEWQGSLTTGQGFIFFLNLTILAAGSILFYKKAAWLGLLPLAFNAAYHFSNAAARNSGWRYLLPADWIFLLYFAGGIYILINLGKNYLPEKIRNQNIQDISSSPKIISIISVSAMIFVTGFLPLVGESIFPRLYPSATLATARDYLNSKSANLSNSERAGFENILQDPQVVILHGRMLYPRFYAENDGEEKTGKTGYAPMPYSRYVFLIAGEPDGTIIFPHTSNDLPFRNAETALVIGCKDGLGINARAVILSDDQSQLFIGTKPVNWTCTSSK